MPSFLCLLSKVSFEISLSLWQIFISCLGGDVVVALWLQVIIAIVAGLTLIVGVILFGFTVYIGLQWRKIDSVDETLDIIQDIKRDIKTIKKDITLSGIGLNMEF